MEELCQSSNLSNSLLARGVAAASLHVPLERDGEGDPDEQPRGRAPLCDIAAGFEIPAWPTGAQRRPQSAPCFEISR